MQGNREYYVVNEAVGGLALSANNSSACPCAIGRIKDERGSGQQKVINAIVLYENTDGNTETWVNKDSCIVLPEDTDIDRCCLLPSLSFALWAWDKLNLELGEIAFLSGDTPYTRIFTQTALWRGALSVFFWGSGNDDIFDGVEKIKIDNEQTEGRVAALNERIKGNPGFSAIELSGQAESIDILLELLPQWGRLMLASKHTSAITVDYYNNIHRKGANIMSCVFDPSNIFEWKKRQEFARHIKRGIRILQNKEMAQKLV